MTLRLPWPFRTIVFLTQNEPSTNAASLSSPTFRAGLFIPLAAFPQCAKHSRAMAKCRPRSGTCDRGAFRRRSLADEDQNCQAKRDAKQPSRSAADAMAATLPPPATHRAPNSCGPASLLASRALELAPQRAVERELKELTLAGIPSPTDRSPLRGRLREAPAGKHDASS